VLSAPRRQAVVIGASAGGFAALERLLPALPAGYPLPVLVVQHLHRLQEGALLAGLARRCALTLREAEPGLAVEPGTVYFAPANYHLLVEPTRRLALSIDEKVHWCRPAIDVTFESAALAWGPGLVGVILTGANRDGAAGLQAVRARGGLAVVQDPADAEIAFMPGAALAAGPVDHVVRLDGLAALLLALAGPAGLPSRGVLP
jgi:two-component system chemotaxis response regulator CheB